MGQKVLVVDDDFLIRWSLTQTLSQAGCEVTTAEDGFKAIEKARDQHFDFVITDLSMPYRRVEATGGARQFPVAA